MFVKGNRTFVYINFQIFKFGIPILGDGIKILNEDIDLHDIPSAVGRNKEKRHGIILVLYRKK